MSIIRFPKQRGKTQKKDPQQIAKEFLQSMEQKMRERGWENPPPLKRKFKRK